MIPLKAFQSFSNTSIQWDGQAKKATIIRDSTVIKLTAGERTAFINNKPVQLDAAAKVVDGRVTLPLRFIAEALGARITVDSAANTVWVQEKARAAIVKNYNSSDLVISRIAALQMPVDESKPSQLTGDNEALSATYYFPEGKSESYFVVYGHFVTYYEIRDYIRKAVWEADLDRSKEAASLFGHPVLKEYGSAPVLSNAYAYFYTSVWGSQIIYGMIFADGTTKEPGQGVDWPDTRKHFIVAIPGETKL